MNRDWKEKVKDFCEKYNIPLLYLSDTLYEPKVVPMIRGKAFEFSVMTLLQNILPKDKWKVEKLPMNAETGIHDIDVKVTNVETGKVIRIECKLSKKGGYRYFQDGHSEIRVKCMRSRTLGPSKVKELAPKLKVEPKVLAVHNDQYLPADFDVVITSIANAFYQTDPKTEMFEWKPTREGEAFLRKIAGNFKVENLKDFAFFKTYVARTKDLAITQSSGVICTRSKCKNKKACGFIPNYPIMRFDPKTNKPENGWIQLEDSLSVFESFLK